MHRRLDVETGLDRQSLLVCQGSIPLRTPLENLAALDVEHRQAHGELRAVIVHAGLVVFHLGAELRIAPSVGDLEAIALIGFHDGHLSGLDVRAEPQRRLSQLFDVVCRAIRFQLAAESGDRPFGFREPALLQWGRGW